MRHFAFRIYRNGNNPACIDLRWLNVWNGCRVGPGRTARTFVAVLLRVRLTLLEAVIGVRCSINGVVCNFTSCAILIFEYTVTTLILSLH